jgi:serine/threonine-protein kinase
MTDPHPSPALDDTVSATGDHTDPSRPRDASHSGPLAPLASLAAETLAGRYELLALLGSGGMGSVYKARDTALNELVAVKVLRAELANDPTMVARFRQEVKLARRVTHANVARTFDLGEHGPHRFLTMELIEGVSLADAMRHPPPLSVPRIVAIAGAICAGLSAAHAAGIVHRDLKPDNVLLAHNPAGRVVITDFGIARVADAAQHEAVRTVGTPIGTPAYMSPEQVEGALDLDARTDIYALGAMLYELFTGARAWQGDSVFWVASRRLIEPPPDPRERRPELPALAAEVVLRCMARAKADRYQTAEEVRSALAAIETPPSRSSLLPASAWSGGSTAGTGSGSVAVPGVQPAARTVAVLPFRNAGPEADAYLADGLTDDLIDVLSMTPGLRVCGRGVVMGRTAGTRDPQKLGVELGVSVVVEGTLRHVDGRLRVTARLLSVTDGFQLWAQRFDRDAGAMLSMSDEVARAVTAALTLRPAQAAREQAPDGVALDLYLRARHEYFKFWRENVIQAIALFEQALARAPDDPMILAGYAMALVRRTGQDDSTDAEADGARRAAERALALSPESAPARVALAQVLLLSGKPEEAAREVRAVLDRHPDFADAVELAGRMLVECGPPAAAIRPLERALELEPDARSVNMELARLHALLGDRAASEAFFGDEPANAGLSNVYWLNRCRVALWLGDFERARAWRADLESRDGAFPGAIMMLRAMTGDLPTDEEVHAVLGVATSGTKLLRRRAFYSQLVCEFTASFGRTEVALVALETADAGALFDATWLERCAPLDAIRHDPRFVAVRERVLARATSVRAALGVEGGA